MISSTTPLCSEYKLESQAREYVTGNTLACASCLYYTAFTPPWRYPTRHLLLMTLSLLTIALYAPLRAIAETTGPNRTAVMADHDLIQSITKVTVGRNRDGSGTTWFHPRACMVPGARGRPKALMNLQKIGGSDYFGQVHWSESDDLGKNWSTPEPIAALSRDPVEGHPGLKAGVCDVTPQYHPQTGTVLALGHVVFYRGPRFTKNDQLARYPVYAIRRKDGSWSPRKTLKWDDPRGAHIYTNNCGQRVVLPNGDIMMSFTFGPEANHRMVAGVRCSFDGEALTIIEVGPPLENNVGRGLLEPSLTKFKERFYLTLRAEDGHGYVAVSEDGLNYRRKTAWAWDDGEPVEMSTTQQHWLAHSDALFLVYTRKDASNANVIRWRSPLWVAQVDTEQLCLVRESEQVVLPLVGDGVNHPDEVALMGNFHVTNASPTESWVTVGEWVPRRGAKGDLLLARIKWSKPNALAPHFTGR
ncbi:MAG: sialidase family protein [Pirellulaceae bacterium]